MSVLISSRNWSAQGILGLPVLSIAPEVAADIFGWMAPLVQADLTASGTSTRRELDWSPTGPDLLTDLRNFDDAGS